MKRTLPIIFLFLTACSSIGQAAVSQLNPTFAVQTAVVQQVLALDTQQTAVANQVQTLSAALPTQSTVTQPIQPSGAPAVRVTPTVTKIVVPTLTQGPSPTPENNFTAQGWGQWPVVPTPGKRAKEIYQRGLLMGNNPQRYSVAGDCQSVPNVFMGIFDGDRYRLSDKEVALAETIANFKGQFIRNGVAVKAGFGISSILSPVWSDIKLCQPSESPLECEVRINKPSILFINMGTNWKNSSAEAYEKVLRQVVDYSIAHGILPILSSKIDNIEGDHSINKVTAAVAHDYDLPYWNLWLAADNLPNHGLDSDRGDIYFSTDAQYLREFSGLRALDAVWRGVR
ncbi:MAG: hypothetical protein WCG34_10975 [Leptolinea sp.]